MADDKETLFTVNAGQILAKLHLAGKEAAKDKHFIVINSGMKDEADDNTAENPGKSLFDLTNKSGEYEVCFVTDLPFLYKEQIVLSADPDVQKSQEDLSTAKENARDAEDNNNNQGITSLLKNEAPKANEDVKKAQQDLNIIALKATGAKIPKDATAEERKEAIDKENEKREADKDKNLSVWKKNAVDAINIYFLTMAGKDTKKITEKDLVMVQFPEEYGKLSDFEIKDFKIKDMEEADINKWREEVAKNQDKVLKIRLGFKTTFNVEVETM